MIYTLRQIQTAKSCRRYRADYTQCEDDDTQNEVCISLTPAEATDVLDQSVLSMTNEQTIACAVLNHELSEYTTKATIYTPSGDVIMFK